jgi:predicted component of type VI protein secretion system
VNGRDLAEGESVRLADGDRVTMGEVEFVYQAG